MRHELVSRPCWSTDVLSVSVIRELERALVIARGNEIAGLLLEDSTGRQCVQLAPNLAGEPGAFEVPRWWLERMLGRRDPLGYQPRAFFHSHESSLDASETDRASMQGSPLPWIIIQLQAGQLSWVELPGALNRSLWTIGRWMSK